MPTKSTSPDGRVTYVAGAPIQRGQALKFDANGNVVPATAATDAVIGVAFDDAPTGDLVPVQLLGVANGTVLILATGTIAAGALVNALGASAAAGNAVIGRALTAAASGELCELAHTTAYTL